MNQLKLWIIIITLSLTVGSSFIAIKIVLDSIPPLFAFSIRFMITGDVLILVSYIFDRKSQEIKKNYILAKCFVYWCLSDTWWTWINSIWSSISLCRNCFFTEFNN